MLKVRVINYPALATSSKVEVMCHSEQVFWSSERPITETHIFGITEEFWPLKLALLQVFRNGSLMYEIQGTDPGGPNYMEVTFYSDRAVLSVDFDMATETWVVKRDIGRMAWIIGGIAVGFVAVVALAEEGQRQEQRR